jgi:hypothetical protein
MMLPLRIARHLGADHAGCVRVVRRAAHLADARAVDALDLKAASAGTIVGTDGMDGVEGHKRKDSMGIKRGLTLWITV